jgi:hypothetical protein
MLIRKSSFLYSAVLIAASLSTFACGSDEDEGQMTGGIDTSNTDYCMDYVEMCPGDSLRNIKEEACIEECADGVKVAAASTRDAACWKAVCSLELGICEDYEEPAQTEYHDAIDACARRHGWYEE